MNDLKGWLDSQEKDWNTGLDLLSLHSKNPTLIRSFRVRGFSAGRLEALIYELSKLSGVPAPSTRKPQKKIKQPPSPAAPPLRKITSKKGDHPELDDLHHRKNGYFKHYVALFHQIEFMSTAQRALNALRILDLWDKIEDLWSKINFFDKFGHLPVDPPDRKNSTPQDQAELLRRQMTLRTYVSKYTRKLKTATTGKTRHKYQELLNQYRLELTDIERKLNR